MKKEVRSDKTYRLALTGILSALIIVMTAVPYTGYISYANALEITTLHVVVILGAVSLSWTYGAALGGVWGITCMLRAFTNPAWAPFTNPIVSVLPRIIVGMVAGLVFAALKKTRLNKYVSAAIAAAAATLTNTLLVLFTLFSFEGLIKGCADFINTFKTVFVTVISINGVIELALAVVLVPVIYSAIQKSGR